ncbi:Exocyst complex component 2 [Platanthera zijinensis]|uniref:Exocyst complex component 2 n=1 Tax=Platanthera zijinensis TaxID=2320716 RepID=A0AAP0BUV1_9ASPA
MTGEEVDVLRGRYISRLTSVLIHHIPAFSWNTLNPWDKRQRQTVDSVLAILREKSLFSKQKMWRNKSKVLELEEESEEQRLPMWLSSTGDRRRWERASTGERDLIKTLEIDTGIRYHQSASPLHQYSPSTLSPSSARSFQGRLAPNYVTATESAREENLLLGEEKETTGSRRGWRRVVGCLGGDLSSVTREEGVAGLKEEEGEQAVAAGGTGVAGAAGCGEKWELRASSDLQEAGLGWLRAASGRRNVEAAKDLQDADVELSPSGTSDIER